MCNIPEQLFVRIAQNVQNDFGVFISVFVCCAFTQFSGMHTHRWQWSKSVRFLGTAFVRFLLGKSVSSFLMKNKLQYVFLSATFFFIFHLPNTSLVLVYNRTKKIIETIHCALGTDVPYYYFVVRDECYFGEYFFFRLCTGTSYVLHNVPLLPVAASCRQNCNTLDEASGKEKNGLRDKKNGNVRQQRQRWRRSIGMRNW